MRRKYLVGLFAGIAAVLWATAAGLWWLGRPEVAVALPTLLVLPSDTATWTASPTGTPTATPTFTLTPTGTASSTPTATLTPSATTTLATRVLRLTVLNADVPVALPAAERPTEIPAPLPTFDVPFPPAYVAPATAGADTSVGWAAYEVNDPALQFTGKWDTYRTATLRYVYSDDTTAGLSFRFLGAGLRLRYVAFYRFGAFQIRLDGKLLVTVDSYYSWRVSRRGALLSTAVFSLPHGWHLLEVMRTGDKNPASAGTMIAMDGIEVYRAGPPPTPTVTATSLTSTPTAGFVPARRVNLVAAPPTVRATATSPAPTVIRVSLSIAYDANGNRVVDPAEGVRGIPARLVAVGSNAVIASGFTDNRGIVRLEALSGEHVRLVVSYFGKYWEVSRADQQFTLLIPPSNQPALIP